jgi:lipopolysaccharide export system permease protein
VTILDRMLFFSFIRAYFICLTSMLSLYIIVDMFTNLDDFSQPGRSALEVAQQILTYYGYRSLQYYDRLCEAISLLAAMFTVAWAQRSNEFIPVLSAGVSTQRFLRPVFLGAGLMLVLGMLNQEFVIPRISNILVTDREDFDGTKELMVQGAYDPNKIHIDGMRAYRSEQIVQPLYVTLPQTNKSRMTHVSAETATYIPAKEGEELSGGWLLTGAAPAELGESSFDPAMIKMIDPGKYFIYVREATFDAATRGQKTQVFASTYQLFELMKRTDVGRMNALAVLFHMRFARPFVGFLLVVLGLSIILRDQTRHVFISAGLCLMMCAIFFGVVVAAKFMGSADVISPPLAAWLPILIFGPFAIVFYNAIQT